MIWSKSWMIWRRKTMSSKVNYSRRRTKDIKLKLNWRRRDLSLKRTIERTTPCWRSIRAAQKKSICSNRRFCRRGTWISSRLLILNQVGSIRRQREKRIAVPRSSHLRIQPWARIPAVSCRSPSPHMSINHRQRWQQCTTTWPWLAYTTRCKSSILNWKKNTNIK